MNGKIYIYIFDVAYLSFSIHTCVGVQVQT